MSSSFRILIVEDNVLTAMSLQTGLSEKGFVVSGVASNYKDAVKLIRSEKPDLLLVDIELGDGAADGIAVAREMRRQGNAPIIFLTGSMEPADFDESMEINPVAFLNKPFRVDEVSRQVTLALHNHYGSSQNGIVGRTDALYIPDGNDRVRVNLEEVVYVEADGAYTKIMLVKSGQSGLIKFEKMVSVNLANVKVHLPSHFYDVSRSLTINLKYLDRIGSRSVLLGPYEVEIPAGKGKLILESVKLVRSEKKKPGK